MILPLADGTSLDLSRPRIMGILNVTPDSFSDGGRHTTTDLAVDHARQMVSDGADLIDVGGESTRPGSQRVSASEQKKRIVDVVRALPSSVIVSVDTTLTEVAQAALDAGADMINDISAGRDDKDIFTLAAARRVPIVLMHMQGTPATMQENPTYVDVVSEVLTFLRHRADLAQQAGVPRECIVLDPGIGFGKTREHNLLLLRHLHRFVDLGYAILLGTSRKRFMGSICQIQDGQFVRQPAPHELIGATCATTALGVAAGVQLFRVHDVRENRQAADVAWAIGHRKFT